MQKKKGKNSIKVLTLAMLLLLLSPASESISVKHLMIKLPSILLLKHPPPHPTIMPPSSKLLSYPSSSKFPPRYQGYNARKVISEVYAYIVLQSAVYGR